ncbi:MAG: DUF5106 domain-containing protein [Cytophagales bacterium]|nr:DUF5106 domain-containing protein [Cytophagales bacterium]
MKKIHTLIMFSLTVICAFKYADIKPAYSLKYKVTGLKEKDTVFLANYYGDKQYLKDTAIVGKEGKFVFEGKNKLDPGIYLVVLPGKQYFETIVDEQSFTMETNTTDYTRNMKVTGSVENQVFYEYLKFIVEKGARAESQRKMYDSINKKDTVAGKKLREEVIALEKEIFEYRKNFIKNNPDRLITKVFRAMSDPEIPATPKLPNGRPDSTFPYRYYKEHYWDNIDLNDDRLIRTPIFHQKLERYIKNMILQIPDSINKEADILIPKVKNEKSEIFKYIIWYITNQYETSNIMGMDAVFVHMAEKYYLAGKAYWINDDIETKIRDRYNTLRLLLLNNYAPVLSMPDTAGKYKSFTSFKTKYTVLIFWDPNCGHCQKEMPKLRDLYVQDKAKHDFEVYAVCTSVEIDPLKNFIKSNKLTFTNVYDPRNETNFRKIYDVYSTPVMYVLDQNKKIIAKRLGVEQLAEFFENYGKMIEARKKGN